MTTNKAAKARNNLRPSIALALEKKPHGVQERQQLLQHALVQTHNSVHLLQPIFHYVSRRARRCFLAHQTKEFGQNDVGGFLVEIACGLVGSTSAGAVGERAGDATRCCSPPESWLGPVVEALARPSELRRLGPLPRGRRSRSVDELRDDHVLRRVKSGSRWWN
jgi:hypothetical protein